MEKMHARCTIQGDTWSVEDVHCFFEFPVDSKDDPKILVRMTEAQFKHTPRSGGPFQLFSRVDEPGSKNIEILGRECWFRDRHVTYWPHGLTTYEGSIDPEELSVVTIYDKSLSDDGFSGEYEYRLSPSKWSEPWHIVTRSYTGDIVVEKIALVTIRDRDCVFEIDTRYDYRDKSSNDGFEAIKRLIIRRPEMEEPYDKSHIIHDYGSVDDICRLMQFASRSHVSCVGSIRFKNEKRTQNYLLNRSRKISDFEEYPGANYLVDREYAQKFLQSGFDALRASGAWQDRIRSAIASLVQPSPRNTDAAFIAHFSALEELIEQFTNDGKSSRILDASSFKKLCQEIKEILETSVHDAKFREQIKRQLPALNNVPLQDRFESFCEAFSVQYKDLWPAFAGSPVSLYKIRNRLVHSRAISYDEMLPVSYAADSLRALLERCVLSLLKWPIAESDVDPKAFACKYIAGRDLSRHVVELERVWSAQG